jgi:hypothetical protein
LGPEIHYLLLLLLLFYECSKPTQNTKKKLNVGEVQTLPPLQFVISQRETEKERQRTQRDRAKMGRKQNTSIWVAENYEVFGLSERVGYLEKANYYDL